MAPYGETAETFEEERSSCSGNIVDEDTMQSVRMLPILEGDNGKESARSILPKHMRYASHTLNLASTTDAARL